MDTAFWRANKELQLADEIKEKIAMYRAGLPVNLPVTDEIDLLQQLRGGVPQLLEQQQLLLHFAGLGFEPDQPYPALTYRPDQAASAASVFKQIKDTQGELTETLPTTYEYLCRLHGR